jgi:TRAP-type C4-dicarboxylate transport system permease small subunit
MKQRINCESAFDRPMTGPQFAPEAVTSWRRLVTPAAIFLGACALILWLASDIRDWAFSWLQPALNWSREQNDASVVQAAASILQAITVVNLIILTWYNTKTSREMAESARRQAAAGMAEHGILRPKRD